MHGKIVPEDADERACLEKSQHQVSIYIALNSSHRYVRYIHEINSE